MIQYKECEVCGATLDPGERCDCTEVGLPAISCTQLPIISENLNQVSENLKTLVAGAVALPKNDDSLKQVKKLRAELSKEFARMEEQRKSVKRQVMAPYESAEKKYKEFISDPYRTADNRLREWVDEYQNSMKDACREYLKDYFDELCAANGIDFLSFESCGVTVDMAMARQKEPRAAMEQIENHVKSVREDMDTILKMRNAAAVMAEYRSHPNLAHAVYFAQGRAELDTEMQNYISAQRERNRKKRDAVAELLEAAPELAPEPEEIYTVCFKATGTLPALKAMKAHGQAVGVVFEELQEVENDAE